MRCRTSATTWWLKWWNRIGTPSWRKWRRWRMWTRCWMFIRTSSTVAWRTACWRMRISCGTWPSYSKSAPSSANLFRWVRRRWMDSIYYDPYLIFPYGAFHSPWIITGWRYKLLLPHLIGWLAEPGDSVLYLVGFPGHFLSLHDF